MINGIINVYKEAGYTSHDVVARLRGILKQKKIGHTGTLDPDAVGVLPVCLGSGTRLCDMLTGQSKEYRAGLLLGIETDTQDISGRVLAEKEVRVSEQQTREAILSFVGGYDQIPPMYSAIKVGGRKLYQLAREGREVERSPRRVEIHFIEIERLSLPEATLRVGCSKGTYIRTLCSDIGRRLGCGGTMQSLERTRVGEFSIEDALTLDQIERLQAAGELEGRILPVETVFADLPAVTVKKKFQKLIDNGNAFYRHMLLEKQEPAAGEQVRVYNEEGSFYGIFVYQKEGERFRPVKMFMEK
ncbi:MAG: tRNA pseudouridine(55) synthase TruB [Lachnospiraceae bacterium]|nr:tRNA pseudouridine(55) synthase TruB [Lachnospiraceae bacterium]